ncbi:hypothetical protein AMR41_19965 [Hapalosiphon sp. MRB220]|nr:hypothetical protein AMR41_19965 [Hapalosiphon sp. MRB220]
MALSVKGVARKYGGIVGGFSVVKNIFGGSVTGSVSLRAKLESMARQEFSFNYSECIYDGRAAFEQTWSHIRVRIKLNPDAGISVATMNALKTKWQNRIENTWSNQWGCGRSGEVTCPFTFEVQWVDSNEHHKVQVRQCPVGDFCRSNEGLWDTNDDISIPHEFGHMLGNPDEYGDPNCPSRNPVNTGTVMDDNSPNIPARLLTRFANNVGSNVVSLT